MNIMLRLKIKSTQCSEKTPTLISFYISTEDVQIP